MERNVPLLEQTMQHILDHPDQYKQSVWLETAENECGTAACMAGWACLLSGLSRDEIALLIGQSRMTEESAKLLGLEFREGRTLFHEANTVPMLQLMVKDLVNGEPLLSLWKYHQLAHPDLEEFFGAE